MSSRSWGGKREGAGSGGARPGAGRKKTRFAFSELHYVVQRGRVGVLPQPPELFKLVSIHDDYLEFEIVVDGTSEILQIVKQSAWNGG